MPGRYTDAVRDRASTPIPVDSFLFVLLIEYRNPTSSTMNEAPSLEPDSIVKACSSFSASAANRESATTATGDPDRTRYAPIHPRPSVLTALSTGNVPFRSGARALAPDFMSWMARMNRKIAATPYATFVSTRLADDGGRRSFVRTSAARTSSRAISVPSRMSPSLPKVTNLSRMVGKDQFESHRRFRGSTETEGSWVRVAYARSGSTRMLVLLVSAAGLVVPPARSARPSHQ